MSGRTKQPLQGIKGEHGYALLSVFLLIMIIGGLAGASLVGTRLGMQSTANMIAANDAFYAAESGLLDALSVINGTGVISFQSDVVEPWERWDRFGASVKTMPGHPSVRYAVTVAAAEEAPDESGEVEVTGYASDQARRTIRARLCKGPLLPTGAIHILKASSCGVFLGNAFQIDGNDHLLNGDACDKPPHRREECRSEPVPGISTADTQTQDCIEQALDGNQEDNVRGAGGEPSVIKTGGPSSNDLTRLVEHILANPNVVSRSDRALNGNTKLGTKEQPQITHLDYGGPVDVGGQTTGAGILIADDDLRLSGNVNFSGWIITAGELSVLGNVNVLGTIWTGAFRMVAGGSMNVDYCADCLDLIDTLSGTVIGNFPRLMRVCGWSETS